jgi:hypothetical protein
VLVVSWVCTSSPITTWYSIEELRINRESKSLLRPSPFKGEDRSWKEQQPA